MSEKDDALHYAQYTKEPESELSTPAFLNMVRAGDYVSFVTNENLDRVLESMKNRAGEGKHPLVIQFRTFNDMELTGMVHRAVALLQENGIAIPDEILNFLVAQALMSGLRLPAGTWWFTPTDEEVQRKQDRGSAGVINADTHAEMVEEIIRRTENRNDSPGISLPDPKKKAN